MGTAQVLNGMPVSKDEIGQRNKPKEIVIKALLLSPIIMIALAINPVWGAGEATTDKPSVAKKHKATKKHRATRKTRSAKVPPVVPSQGAVPPATTAASVVPPPAANPYLPAARSGMAAVIVPSFAQPPINPYLQPILLPPVVSQRPPAVVYPAIARTLSGEPVPTTLTYLPYGVGKPPEMPTIAGASTQLKSLVPKQLSDLLAGDDGETHWPISYKTVYPTGEKPLWVLTLKCPTEAAFGIAPPPVKVVHILLTNAMDGINYTGLLPVNLQQVCQ